MRKCVELCSLNWIVVSCSYPLLDVFPDVVINVIPCCCYVTWIRVTWLCCSIIDSYHVFMCMRVQFISYLLIISFSYRFMRNPDLTCIVKGWSSGTFIHYRITWRGNWFYLTLQGLLSSCWTNATLLYLVQVH